MNANAATVHDPYYSRIDGPWEAVEREDPVVWGDDPGPLAPDALKEYAESGYLAMPQLLEEDEAEELLVEANRMAATAERGPGVVIEPQSNAVRSLFRIHQTRELFSRICRDPRIVDPVRQILGSEVYIHQSRINFKPALDGKEFFWHSDFETWHIEDGMPRMRALSVSINLTPNTEFNGPLMVVPRSHLLYIRCEGATPENHFQQSLRRQEYGIPSCQAMQMLIERSRIVAPKGPAGSALFFDCNLMHGSVGNLSPWPRTNLFVVYNSVENALQAPFGRTPPRPDFLAERHPTPLVPLEASSRQG